ncbi:MAG: PorV/PorQ family protein [Candidatus Poribacteria bacterium]|nr:PorV/PorQ family protein [Candidatus Poribacteria bacterium]
MPRSNQYFILFLLFAILLYPYTVAEGADIHDNAGTRAMTFLKIGVGAKAISMGESQVADANDLYASYWNPAGLVRVQRPQLGLMHNEWFEGINHQFIGFVQPLGSAGTLGGSLIYLSFGELDKRDETGKELGTFRPYDMALILSYARRFTSALSLGVNAKWVREKIDTESAQVVAFDIGGLYAVPNSSLSLGFNAQHLGTKAKFVEESFSLPVNIKVGAAYKLLEDAFTIAADVNRPSDNDLTVGLGMAFTASELIHLRTGYKYKIGGNDLGTESGLTGGVGFTIEGFQIDYAFVSFGKLGPVHRFSLISNF